MSRIPKGIYKTSDNKRFYTNVQLNELDKNGHHKRFKVYGDTIAEVREKAESVKIAVENGTFERKGDRKKRLMREQQELEMQAIIDRQNAIIREKMEGIDPDNLTLADWYEHWLNQFKAKNLKGYTFSTYRGYLKNYLRVLPDPSKAPEDKVNVIGAYHLGEWRLKDVSGLLLQKFYKSCSDAGLQPKTLHNVAGAISECLEKAEAVGLISNNPATEVELPRVVKKQLEVLNKEEIKMFLTLLHNNQEPRENVIGVILCIGLRVSETLGLSWDNVDFEERTIKICQQLQRRKYTTDSDDVYTLVRSTKNDKMRIIYAPDLCFKYLKAEKEKQEKWKEEYGESWNNKYNLCFTNPDGSNISQMSITKCVYKYGAAIGKPKLRVHDLRHSFATMIAAEPNIPLATLSEMLGHSTTSYTLNIYVHDSEKDDKAAQKKLSQQFDANRPE